MKFDLTQLNYQELLEAAIELQKKNDHLQNELNATESCNCTTEEVFNIEQSFLDMDLLLWIYIFVLGVLVFCHRRPSKVLIYQAAASFDIAVTVLTSEPLIKGGGRALIFAVIAILPLAIQLRFYIKKFDQRQFMIYGGILALAGGYAKRYHHVSIKATDHPWRPAIVVICFFVVSLSASWDIYSQSRKAKKSPKPTKFRQSSFEMQETPPAVYEKGMTVMPHRGKTSKPDSGSNVLSFDDETSF